MLDARPGFIIKFVKRSLIVVCSLRQVKWYHSHIPSLPQNNLYVYLYKVNKISFSLLPPPPASPPPPLTSPQSNKYYIKLPFRFSTELTAKEKSFDNTWLNYERHKSELCFREMYLLVNAVLSGYITTLKNKQKLDVSSEGP
jgi:hypothetical protein